ncbi:hypothetical protein WN51_08479 [Melipona quadrifasciata]|uniref:Uncharacterized protein n=1 Tax=Melipona quadrifasciata TaxID=166423 RepID=A0A0N0U7B7_9HYME|nr:hypothetical protein WN51_08479 [Melipona quadrifasciata]
MFNRTPPRAKIALPEKYSQTTNRPEEAVHQRNCRLRRTGRKRERYKEEEEEEEKNGIATTKEDEEKRPRIPQIRVSNTRLAQAAGGCAPSVDVLPIFDVKQQSVRNPARMMGANQP